jgi:uncharacterized protein YsxB (DUF464 family)
MIVVTFRRDGRGRLSSVVSRGHADQGPHGADIACAAVSALLQAAWAGLTDVAGVPVEGHRREGDLAMRWPPAARERADVHAIVATAELAIGQIAKQYRGAVRAERANEPDEQPEGEIPGRDASKGTAR